MSEALGATAPTGAWDCGFPKRCLAARAEASRCPSQSPASCPVGSDRLGGVGLRQAGVVLRAHRPQIATQIATELVTAGRDQAAAICYARVGKACQFTMDPPKQEIDTAGCRLVAMPNIMALCTK